MAYVVGQSYIKKPGRPLVGVHKVRIQATTNDQFTIRKVSNGAGIHVLSSSLATAPAFATGTIQIANNAFDAGDDVTIAGQKYEFVGAPAVAFDVAIGANVNATAANLAAAINLGAGSGTAYHASTTRNPHVTATVVTDTVTVTSKYPGAIGNFLTLAETDGITNNIVRSGDNLTGGSGVVASVLSDLSTVVIEGGTIDDTIDLVTIHDSAAGINYSSVG